MPGSGNGTRDFTERDTLPPCAIEPHICEGLATYARDLGLLREQLARIEASLEMTNNVVRRTALALGIKIIDK